ncbi:protein kinase domain-containing protein [Streptomyces sp. DSM 15324]|uniref:protein kinase domain-containing protein n=1 Tax=Streptomyces sp. DSM 15324 TaxID=1739111 RepID=UPI00074ABFA5|nr:PQQ-binding-like beta-propeller repeat protein [Streptomyces sp. DSM 15324]KUO13242.1 serine/threonine protein kinase [Streptomyces sp. DSM 15324]
MPLTKGDPKALGGYRIVDRLGAGGMGVVYLGRSRSGRDVAVKLVHAQYAEDGVFRARFRQEIEAVRKVSGAFTAPVVDADPEAVRPWMATQYVPGAALSARIREDGPLQGAELRRLALGLVEALRDIHRAGVVHRDLKPANVLMAEDGPRVIDFGISRATENQTLTETGHAIGTPPFMSPEQFKDARSVGPASDVFSLGALLVFAATGHGPFDADSPYMTAYRVMHEEPSVDSVAEPLRSVLVRCLAKEADERPGLDELGRALASALPEPETGEVATVTLRTPPVRPVPEGPSRAFPPDRGPRLLRWPVLAAVAGVLAVALTGYLLFDPFRGAGARAEPDATGAASSRWAPLPEGWKPWRTSLFATAASGVREPLGGADDMVDGGSLSCTTGRGALYCGGNGTLPIRVDGATGRIVWRAEPLPAGVTRERYDSTPLGVHDDVVLVSQSVLNRAGNDSQATLLALDARTGERRWSRATASPYEMPAVVGDLLLSSDGLRVTARDLRDGGTRWTTTLPAGAGYGCKVHDVDGLPYAGCTNAGTPSRTVFYAVDPADGTPRKVSVPDGDAEYLGTVDGDLVFVMHRRQDRTLADTTYSEVLLIDPDTAAVRKKKLAGGPRGRVSLAGGVLCFASSSGLLTAYAPATGERLWATSTTLQQPGEPVADGQGRTVFAASASGRAAALDAARGTLLWESPARADHVAEPGYATARVFLDEGALMVLCPDGTVVTLDPGHPDLEPVSG